MKGKRVNISFKATTKDNELYDAIMKLEEKSETIKDILRKYLVDGNLVISKE